MSDLRKALEALADELDDYALNRGGRRNDLDAAADAVRRVVAGRMRAILAAHPNESETDRRPMSGLRGALTDGLRDTYGQDDTDRTNRLVDAIIAIIEATPVVTEWSIVHSQGRRPEHNERSARESLSDMVRRFESNRRITFRPRIEVRQCGPWVPVTAALTEEAETDAR